MKQRMNHFNKTIHIIGTGMDGDRTLTLEARRAIEQAELLIGAQRMLKPFEALKKPMLCCYDGRKTAALIADSEYSEIAVLVSGDGGFYSAAGTLLPLLREYRTELISGISTPVYLCAKAGLPWSDMRFVSLHGTDAPFVRTICANRYTFLLLGGRVTPADVCRRLCEYGRGEVRVVIGENLSSPKEAVHSGTAAEYREYNADRLCAMIVENEQYERHLPSCIPDGAFIRGGVPMTKSEVRGVCVARLTVGESDVCWDIGCGTGSVSVEMALRCPKGRVLAVDKNAEAISLTDGHYGPLTQNPAREVGDFLVRRADGVYAYQLAVSVDDMEMGVTRVVRGRDLLTSAPRQKWLIETLGGTAPSYCHAPLLTQGEGKLSKRLGSLSTQKLRRTHTPEQLVGKLAFLCGLRDRPEPATPRELLADFSWEKVERADIPLPEGLFDKSS